ncbi:ammonia monooxygenase subunit A [Solimonas aquatica]|uniref:Ammonia monooxygenase subunit A n=1 Tax=Solimonas aquatica TaxID=489703 RepID=A0A1H9JC80_9GAMM|nr:methane monooxygenase/ammonia monooxygenase subunit A [Solimonas aquatica]SEQ84470.1 ammonia monooxygenase subunit A [Solimonas aquatica]
MTENDREVLRVAGLSGDTARWSRTFDYLIIVVAAFLVLAVTYINFLLLAGDWDFFTDFKDRQYWVVIYPIVQIMMAAAFQAVFWTLFRLPFGATASAFLFGLGVWLVRYHSWMGMAHFPLTLVVPGTFMVGAMILDGILTVSRAWLVTGLFGGTLFGITFYASNWIVFAPYFQPVENMGQLSSLADVIGYVFPRAGTPEYIRIIERGTLRTFSDSSTWVSVFFSCFICIFMYMLWWLIGAFACKAASVPTGDRFKLLFGMKPAEATK